MKMYRPKSDFVSLENLARLSDLRYERHCKKVSENIKKIYYTRLDIIKKEQIKSAQKLTDILAPPSEKIKAPSIFRSHCLAKSLEDQAKKRKMIPMAFQYLKDYAQKVLKEIKTLEFDTNFKKKMMDKNRETMSKIIKSCQQSPHASSIFSGKNSVQDPSPSKAKIVVAPAIKKVFENNKQNTDSSNNSDNSDSEIVINKVMPISPMSAGPQDLLKLQVMNRRKNVHKITERLDRDLLKQKKLKEKEEDEYMQAASKLEQIEQKCIFP